ncbi:Multidrug resistance protein MdtA precursor [Symmachiella macrocystis]|uniref:Multidrug resistance protein MdtA n=1 Tax=Symmachiella macrocystis TaxID=2527985 RepID=A0A5C6BML1_9PLAN|nr:HlyD family efflux transporter periplasmic adaptor subunit [Symmachiella macrocystis]TWU11744.1 Multidrug resistance protein MdtA precursor [Symmachiella macrocystis]
MTDQPASARPLRQWLILPPLILGVGVAIYMVAGRTQLKHNPVTEVSRTLRVIPAPQVDVVPRVWGYGTAEPGRTWKAVAEVQGRVIETDPHLKAGSIIAKGLTLLKIDPYELELVAAQLKADIDRVKAQQSELETNEANYRASLTIEDAALALAEQELRRLRQLSQTNAISPADVDAKEREVLAQRQNVQSQRNLLNVLPSKLQALNAELTVKQSSLKQAEIDVTKCVIKAPFSCRLADVDIQAGQFLARGEVLFEAYSTAITEVDAQVPMDQARKLMGADAAPIAPLSIDLDELANLLGIQATVRIRAGDLTVHWDARVTGIREQLDPTTRSIAVVVAVDDPYKNVIPGKRPPLVKGMFCEIELWAKPRAGKIVIPRSAMHDGAVYIVNDERRLEKRAVVVDFLQSDFVCVSTGLHAGEVVVVSDPTPAILGMLVDPVEDDALLNVIKAQATGEGSLK